MSSSSGSSDSSSDTLYESAYSTSRRGPQNPRRVTDSHLPLLVEHHTLFVPDIGPPLHSHLPPVQCEFRDASQPSNILQVPLVSIESLSCLHALCVKSQPPFVSSTRRIESVDSGTTVSSICAACNMETSVNQRAMDPGGTLTSVEASRTVSVIIAVAAVMSCLLKIMLLQCSSQS